MTDTNLHPEHAPPRDATLPYLYSAPIALAVAGGMLVHWGPLALSTPWSAPSLSATHIVTLGFLTMVCAGLFTPLLAVAGGSPAPWHRATHVVYYALVVGLVGFTVGIAQSWPAPVFVAIGAVGVMGVVFITHGFVSLRRARHRGPTTSLLGVALWGFFLAASLGLWLAHGHGGMEFPGPRPLWLQVHVSVALLGWVGASLAAVTAELLPERMTGRIPDGRGTSSLALPIAVGVTGPALLLLAQFFGLLRQGDTALPAIAAIATIPAFGAVWIAHPVIAWRALSGKDDAAPAPSPGALRFLRTGFVLGPISLALGVAAFLSEATWLGVLFGWVAIIGWAGSGLHGVLIAAMPYLLSPGVARAVTRRDEALLEAAYAAFAGALLLGVVAIVFSYEIFAHLAGLLVLVDAALLLAVVARSRPAG